MDLANIQVTILNNQIVADTDNLRLTQGNSTSKVYWDIVRCVRDQYGQARAMQEKLVDPLS